jgi:FkbM family methyltransferase
MNLKVLFTQLRPWMAFKMIAFTASSRLFNPYANMYYSFTAEDQVINSLLGDPKTGFYVDVGSYHPIRFSNSFAFYLRGWKGITIDANAQMVDLHRKIRPRDISICSAVSDSEKEVVFTRFSVNSISSISPEFVEEFKKNVPVLSEEIVKTKTLTGIFTEQQVPREFDFLSIDVEGHDLEVLHGLDLAIFRPKLIIIEMRGLNFDHPHSNPVLTHLDLSGYKIVAFYNINGFFLRKDLTERE